MCRLSQPCVDDLSHPDGNTDRQSLKLTFVQCEAWQEEQTSEMLPAMQQQATGLLKKECMQSQGGGICRTV